jgi:hypothetical protein
MQRRDALKLLFTGAVMPALSPEAFAFFRKAHPGAGYTLRTLNPHQDATIVAMTDLIIPETDTPGAKGAKVNEFIDLILTDWATEEERTNFLNGVAGVDKQSSELFGKDFVGAAPAQQIALLRAIDDAALTQRAPAQSNSNFLLNPAQARDTQLQGVFWTVFKRITLHGYYTSEIGFTQELKLQIIPGAYHGCTAVSSEQSKA